MANREHLKILKRGVEVWNQWRKDNPDVKPDFSDADLSGRNLSFVNLDNAILHDANLVGTILRGANFRSAKLREAKLLLAELNYANFAKTNLIGAELAEAELIEVDLRGANLRGTNLMRATFTNPNLHRANLIGATCSFTVFADTDLSTTKGLDQINHFTPSTIGVDTFFRSRGKIPEIFLRGCGVPETLITFLPSMLEEAIQFYSCFISYSHADKEFAKRLHDRLQGVGIRCWLDEHQLNPGDKLHSTIYGAIRVFDKVILCCSKTALTSKWVEEEFENAVAKEKSYQETILIPLSLDEYLFEQSADEWLIGEIREKRFVQDFTNWKNHDAFEQSFKQVVKALRTDGGKPPPPASKLTKRK